jgi:hypothetical protein
MTKFWASALGGALAASSSAVLAQDYPVLKGEVELGVQFDHAFDADAGGQAHLSDLYADSGAALALEFSPALSIQSGLVLEPVRSLTEDRYFDDQGLYVEELFLNYERDWLSVRGGKFNPNFGVAWDRTPGLYGTDFAEDYEITEQVGFGGALRLETAKFGKHELGAAVFFADTSFLSDSVFTRPSASDPDVDRPGRLRKRNGGPGNTESLESYAISLDGGEFPLVPELKYHLSHIRRAAGATERYDEKGYAAGVEFALDLGGEASLNPIVELAWFDHFGGQNQDALYLTWGAELALGQWSLAFSRTGRRLDEPDDGSGPLGGNTHDRLIQLSVGYQFDNGLGLGAGVKNERVQGVDTNFVGLLVTYNFDFQLGGQ